MNTQKLVLPGPVIITVLILSWTGIYGPVSFFHSPSIPATEQITTHTTL